MSSSITMSRINPTQIPVTEMSQYHPPIEVQSLADVQERIVLDDPKFSRAYVQLPKDGEDPVETLAAIAAIVQRSQYLSFDYTSQTLQGAEIDLGIALDLGSGLIGPDQETIEETLNQEEVAA